MCTVNCASLNPEFKGVKVQGSSTFSLDVGYIRPSYTW